MNRLVEGLKDVVRILFSATAASLCLFLFGAGFCPLVSILIGVAHWAILIRTSKAMKRAYGLPKGTCPTKKVIAQMVGGFLFTSFLLGTAAALLLRIDLPHALGFGGMFTVAGMVLSLASNLVTRLLPARKDSACD